LIDTTPFLNKESLRVALLSFYIAAYKGTEEIGVWKTTKEKGRKNQEAKRIFLKTRQRNCWDAY
jgi:hypothetical protein